jgi:hypothetical protein
MTITVIWKKTNNLARCTSKKKTVCLRNFNEFSFPNSTLKHKRFRMHPSLNSNYRKNLSGKLSYMITSAIKIFMQNNEKMSFRKQIVNLEVRVVRSFFSLMYTVYCIQCIVYIYCTVVST